MKRLQIQRDMKNEQMVNSLDMKLAKSKVQEIVKENESHQNCRV